MPVTVQQDLTVSIGDTQARLSPGESFKLAERLIRAATVRMIVEETENAGDHAKRRLLDHVAGRC